MCAYGIQWYSDKSAESFSAEMQVIKCVVVGDG